ncbi:hypothetical protein BH10BAC5_BH10BAC5_22370 [soil metagenome]
MKKFFSLLLFISFLIAQSSFGQNTKAYILSEGSFSPGSAKLSLYKYAGNSFSLNIFSPGNIGLYPDGLNRFQSNLYMVEQGGFGGAGKIYKLDSSGTTLSSNTFGINPYSLTIVNNKIYATNGPASKVTVLNLNTLAFIKDITVGAYPQEIFSFHNKVFVCNTSAFGGNNDSSVSVINTSTDSVVARIFFNYQPIAITVSNDQKLLIGTTGVQGKIYKIDPDTYQSLDSFTVIGGVDKDICVDKNSSYIYYINANNNIGRLNLSTRISDEFILNPNPASSFFYGYNFDYTNNKHFILDAKNFTVSGSLYIYSQTGTLENTFTTGVAPRRIVFDRTNTVSVRNITETVSGFSLNQNYPNPFNPATTIKFSIPENGFISLKIYDAAGKQIDELINDYKQAGVYEVSYSAASLSSGIYFYELNTKTYNEVKKMTLIK